MYQEIQLSVICDAHLISFLYFSYKREGAKEESCSYEGDRRYLARFKHFVALTPEQPRASGVTHIRDERKVHATLRYKKRTLQWSRTELSQAKPSAIPALGGLCWRGSPSSPWLRVSSGASVNLIKKGIVKSSSDSGCEIMLRNPNNFYSNRLSCHEELRSKVGGRGGKEQADTLL